MIYGLYLSAAGVMTSSYRQDVISNNLANAETTGFKRDLALFDERLTEAQARRTDPAMAGSDPRLERLGGGLLAHPTLVDTRQGEFEPTGNPLDVAIEGDGYFTVQGTAGGDTYLTRNGQFTIDRAGYLTLSNSGGQRVLDPKGQPIRLNPTRPATVGPDGVVSQGPRPVGRIGVYAVEDPSRLGKKGDTLLTAGGQPLRPAAAQLRSEYLERSNVDPTTELAELMDTQRQLEANANMIRYQDQTLGRLVNEVGKIG